MSPDLAVRPEKTQQPRFDVVSFLRDYAVLILLVVLVVVLSAMSPVFFTAPNLLNIVTQNAPVAIIAIAGTFVIISGNFDLSVASIYAVGSVVAASIAVATDDVLLGLLAPPVLGMALGLANGFAVTKLHVHSFLATLASSMVFGSLAVMITGGSLITVTVDGFSELGRGRTLGVFNAVWVLLLLVVVGTVLLTRTTFGRHVFAVGGNPAAAELSGLSVDRIRILVFGLSGLAAGIASAIGVSRISSGQPLAGAGLELQAIAAVVLGGTSINGGAGAVWRSIAGVFLIALIGNGFDLMNINPQMKDLVTGVIILVAVAVGVMGRRRRR
ncbi:ABC transporter permease [Kineococcus sp. SYSU DK003]|uniref:ABC transporter permease n=1 Tax=Kineococcus sp. SYSU DK003 TaxID=3383124 RepID=UPI003D7EEB85